MEDNKIPPNENNDEISSRVKTSLTNYISLIEIYRTKLMTYHWMRY